MNKNKFFVIYQELKKMKKGDKFFDKKQKLILIEKLLMELGIKEKELKKYCCTPMEFLFNKTIIEMILLGQEEGYIDMLKSRLGYPEAKGWY